MIHNIRKESGNEETKRRRGDKADNNTRRIIAEIKFNTSTQEDALQYNVRSQSLSLTQYEPED